MENRFLTYMHQFEQAETIAEKQVVAAKFAAQYDALTPDEKLAMNAAMQPSLHALKQWTEQRLDPLMKRAESLLGKKVA